MLNKLMHIQSELKAPKGNYNSYGKYNYRSQEDILEAVKPLLFKYNCSLMLTDEVIHLEGTDRVYVVAKASFFDDETGKSISVSAMAREPDEQKGMTASQITGTASSYARKYALNGLFLIDDTKDPDTEEYKAQTDGVELKKIG